MRVPAVVSVNYFINVIKSMKIIKRLCSYLQKRNQQNTLSLSNDVMFWCLVMEYGVTNIALICFVNLWLHHQHQVISCTEDEFLFLRPQEHNWGPLCLHRTLIGDGIIHVHTPFSDEPPMKLWHSSICIRIETTDVIDYSRHLSR